jgi:hypothetical protein
MSTNELPDCHLCKLPIVKGIEVLLRKNLFHPGCAVVVAKEEKHGHNAHDTRRSEEGDEAGVVPCADPAIN